MTAVRVKSLWLLLIVAKVGGIIVDPSRQEFAENPVARLVEVIPVARAVHGLAGACPSEGRSRVDEACALRKRGGADRWHISWRAQIAVTGNRLPPISRGCPSACGALGK
jgi:hypothetical protein